MDAQLDQHLLEAEGIESFIADENLIAVNQFISNAIGGARLQVMSNEAQRAFELINSETEIVEKATEQKNRYGPFCPECQSDDIYYHKFNRRLIFLSILLLGFPIPFLRRKWICNAWGHMWKKAII